MDRMHGQNNWVSCTDEHGKLDKMHGQTMIFCKKSIFLCCGCLLARGHIGSAGLQGHWWGLISRNYVVQGQIQKFWKGGAQKSHVPSHRAPVLTPFWISCSCLPWKFFPPFWTTALHYTMWRYSQNEAVFIMHQSFVTTAPPPTYGDGQGIGGLMCRAVTFWVAPQCRVSAGLVMLRKYTPVEFTFIKSTAMTIRKSPQCWAFSRALMDETSLSPLFLVGGGGGGEQWLQMTGALFWFKLHCDCFNYKIIYNNNNTIGRN